MNLNILSDEDLAKKFKQEHFEQFQVLVRMHLSFVLDLNTDENECPSEKSKLKKWNLVPFVKKAKLKTISEGTQLTDNFMNHCNQLIEFLKQEPRTRVSLNYDGVLSASCSQHCLTHGLRHSQVALVGILNDFRTLMSSLNSLSWLIDVSPDIGSDVKIEGIFRRTGSLLRQQDLKNLLNKDKLVLEEGTFNVHDCASVLKGFLAELSDPLLTEAHFPAYCQIAELCSVTDVTDTKTQEEKLLEALQLLLLLLPEDNKILLKKILGLLNFTTLYQNTNKMSADNLAKLFTPHLLCPRRLSPEQLHVNSQTLARILSFMITHSSDIFKVPQKLMIDFHARYDNLKNKTDHRFMNESVSDQYAAKTVFTFVDHERTAKENESNPTETALAQLYAHIQSLPESTKKRKLVKQFNKENGYGTPLQLVKSSVSKNKSFGDSIKKHIFHKKISRSIKSAAYAQSKQTSEENLNSPQLNIVSRARLFCTKCDSSSDVSNDETSTKRLKTLSNDNLPNSSPDFNSPLDIKRSLSESALISHNTVNSYLTSTPACLPLYPKPEILFTPECEDHKSVSPITRSTQRMTRAMQETMMTPRSRKPVLLVSGTNINTLPKLERHDDIMDNLTEASSDVCEEVNINEANFRKSKSDGDMMISKNKHTPNNTEEASSLTSTFREYLENRSMVALSTPEDLSFSSCTDDYSSNDYRDLNDTKMSGSLLDCLDGNGPYEDNCDNGIQKNLVLKPKQFDENGQPVIFETSF